MSEVTDPARLARELAEQARWQPRPAFAGHDVFTELVREEFLRPEARAARRHALLAHMLRHAAAQVPWWQRRFEALDAGVESLARPGALRRLPTLDLATLRAHWRELHARRLPAGELLAEPLQVTAADGAPLALPRTARSQGSAVVLRQRGWRWFRFDPLATFAVLRRGRELPRAADGHAPAPGETLALQAWPRVGALFRTGPQVALLLRTPLAAQLAWLREQAPAYLLAPAAQLEQLAVAAAGAAPPPPLRGVEATDARALDDDLRELVEALLAAPLHAQYTSPLFGPVAARCAEGGRFHLHDGHVLAEMVDADGRACRAGERGRLLLTTLTNTALPLLRYDTGDTAVALEGDCACGRGAPAFAAPRGVPDPLPPELARRRFALRRALVEQPRERLAALRGYQLVAGPDGGVELRLAAVGPLHPALAPRLLEAWGEAGAGHAPPLTLRVGAEPERAADGSVPTVLIDDASDGG